MGEAVEHNCGLVLAHSLHDAYAMIKSLQHRGRDACGFAAIGPGKIDVLRYTGKVDSFDLGDLYRIFPSKNKYHTFLAHVRYATKGRKNRVLEDSHPHVIGGKMEMRGEHLIIADCEAVIVHNGQVEENYFAGIDSSLLRSECDSEKLLHLYRKIGEEEIMRTVPGAYTVAIADKTREGVLVFRDKTGIKPGVIGIKDGKFCVASEDVAFRKNGVTTKENCEPGAIYTFNSDGTCTKKRITIHSLSCCTFEFLYIADPDSVIDGISVRDFRIKIGKKMSLKLLVDREKIDYVTYVPRCPLDAAQSLADELSIPFLSVFYKKNNERSFQGSSKSERRKSIDGNLFLLPGIEKTISGCNILVLDDSFVRGTVLSRVKYLLYDKAKVKFAIAASYTPKIGIIGDDGTPRGCRFGVDMPPETSEDHKFITRKTLEDGTEANRNIDEISSEVGMPVRYMTLPNMEKIFESCGMSKENICTFCMGGKHPFKDCK